MLDWKFLVFSELILFTFWGHTSGYSHEHPGFVQRLQIKPLCLQVPQRYTEAPPPTIIFSSLDEVREADAD
ncbi:uncharacterized protein LOC116654794 [Drosophila ananassae]|uniref:uncharacterized protein LOC116654794 n=1 Tax=Drosophila ananassae TaxID=7217 RepID=UPI0013A5D253|nr:uncharacterized protein LOC116654794 [Drosophila ananassae]